jgi:hypothetical protein
MRGLDLSVARVLSGTSKVDFVQFHAFYFYKFTKNKNEFNPGIMKTILTSKEEIIDGEEVTVWYIDKGDGTILINLNKILEEEISDCEWLGTKNKFLAANYTDWDSRELLAIFNDEGQIIRKGISNIETFIEKNDSFIITVSGYGLGEEAAFYNIAADDLKMAVINTSGEFIIAPKFDKIQFEDV